MVIRNKCARNEQSLLSDLFKASDYIKYCQNRICYSKRSIFLHAFAACSEVPSNISTMEANGKKCKKLKKMY